MVSPPSGPPSSLPAEHTPCGSLLETNSFLCTSTETVCFSKVGNGLQQNVLRWPHCQSSRPSTRARWGWSPGATLPCQGPESTSSWKCRFGGGPSALLKATATPQPRSLHTLPFGLRPRPRQHRPHRPACRNGHQPCHWPCH